MALEKTEVKKSNETIMNFSGLWEPTKKLLLVKIGEKYAIKYSVANANNDSSVHYCLKYNQSNLAGKGTFASVYITKLNRIDYQGRKLSPEEQKVAVKVVEITPKSRKMVWNEYFCKDKVPHLNIQAILQSKTTVYLIMSAMPGKDLLAQIFKIRAQQEKTKIRLAYAILRTMEIQIHPDIVHRDIKLDNIMLEGFTQPDDEKKQESPNFFNVNFIDFAFAELKGIPSNNITVGSPGYIAPEIYQPGMSHDKCDVFSIARILELFWSKEMESYSFLDADRARQVSFSAQASLKNDMQGDEKELSGDTIKVYNILYVMLAPNPEQRISIAQAITKFETEFSFLSKDKLRYDKLQAINNNSSPAANPASFFNQHQHQHQQAASSSSSSTLIEPPQMSNR